MLSRLIQTRIEERLFKKKAIVVVGPRQVGKTTMLKSIMEKHKSKSLFLNCDEPDVRKSLHEANTSELRQIIGKHELVIIDEAQRIKNIGLTLKLIHDEIPDIQLLVSGSSSLELANEISEPLTGRKFEFQMFPFSYQELLSHHGLLQEKRQLKNRLIYGSYPDVINFPEDAKELLIELSNNYLYKDIFDFQEVRKPSLLMYILEALALQVGQEVSYNELAQLTGSDPETVKRYIDLLEKTFVVFRLRSFSRNVRNELKKSRKVYFYDNGIRNAIINDFKNLESRNDVGALWENYLVSERMKRNHYDRNFARAWFWRTTQQQEIDYIEEVDSQLSAYEFKYNEKAKAKWPKTFLDNYTIHQQLVFHRENYGDFLTL